MVSVRHVSNMITVTDVNPVKIYSIPSDRRVIIRKIMAYNKDSSANTILIYDGSNQRLPAIQIGASSGVIIGEDNLPSVEFTDDVYIALGTAGTSGIDIVIEFEELLP